MAKLKKVIASWHILAGIYGLVLGVVIFPSSFASSLVYIAVVGFFVLSLFSLAAGILMWKAHPRARLWASVVQILQIPVIYTSILSYEVYLFAKVVVGLGGFTMFANYNLFGGLFRLYIDRQVDDNFIGLNLIAVCILLMILYPERPKDKT